MFPRIIWAPAAWRSPGVSAFTVAWVPTGMNWGVSIAPCVVSILPSRALPTGVDVKE